MQLSLTREQILNLEAMGVENVKGLLESGKFGSYRRELISKWLDSKRLDFFSDNQAKIDRLMAEGDE